MLHLKTATQRILVPRGGGGRTIISMQNMNNKQIHILRSYVYKKEEESELEKAIISADTRYTPLSISKQKDPEIQWKKVEEIKMCWIEKDPCIKINRARIDKEPHFQWLRQEELVAETEDFMQSIQDQVAETKHKMKHMLENKGINKDKYRKRTRKTHWHNTSQDDFH